MRADHVFWSSDHEFEPAIRPLMRGDVGTRSPDLALLSPDLALLSADLDFEAANHAIEAGGHDDQASARRSVAPTAPHGSIRECAISCCESGER
jgi:hypothetical protein